MANYVIYTITILFILGLFMMPNDMNDVGKWWSGKTTKKKPFEVPEEGGVLQKMKKDKDGNISLKLDRKIRVSDDTYIFRFKFGSENDTFGLPIGKHVVFSAKIDGELCQRKYTPIGEITTMGSIDFLIKVYYAGVHPRFPEGGKMSQYLDKMKVG